MELNHKIYELTAPIDLTGEKDIRVIVNDEDRGIKLQEVFKKLMPFEEGRIVGYSILEYYQVKDGMLVDKEGNKIYLATEKHPQILFKKIRDPFAIYSEIEVTRNYVRDAGLLMKLVNTEETVTGLSREDKQALIDERTLTAAEQETKLREAEEEAARIKADEDAKLAEEAKRIAEDEATAKAAEEEARKSEEAAKEAEAAAEAARKSEEDAKTAEAESRAKAEEAAIREAEEAKAAAEAAEAKKKRDMEDGEFFLNSKEYKAAQKKYARLGYTEHTKDGYHFFYGESDEENENYPFILAQREYGYYEQLPGGIVDEDEKTAEFEFTEGDQDKSLILNIAKNTFIITDAE